MAEPLANAVEVSLAEVDPPPWVDRIGPFCLKVLERLGLRGWELSVLLCGDAFMRDLNRRYRGIDAPTDVLSFPQEEGATGEAEPPGASRAVGDLVISPETMARNAAEAGVPADEELKRLVIHGILHLNGMDHPEGGEGPMLGLQEELVAAFGEERIV